ncbi:MAG: hypothetical protein IPM24_16490 [Bryobacterales bacterium]|nr:hypothetical protein [Bryobacterales bacterium]
MAYNREFARKLCTASEFELFAASMADQIGGLTKARLASKIQRTRKLRDKNQDLFRRQQLATRKRSGSKGGKTGVANARTEQKAKLFGEVLTRFEKRLAEIEKGEKREAERAAAKAAREKRMASSAIPKPAVKKNATGGAAKAGFVSADARAAQRERQIKKSGKQAIQGHAAARTRRSQGKRDSR